MKLSMRDLAEIESNKSILIPTFILKLSVCILPLVILRFIYTNFTDLLGDFKLAWTIVQILISLATVFFIVKISFNSYKQWIINSIDEYDIKDFINKLYLNASHPKYTDMISYSRKTCDIMARMFASDRDNLYGLIKSRFGNRVNLYVASQMLLNDGTVLDSDQRSILQQYLISADNEVVDLNEREKDFLVQMNALETMFKAALQNWENEETLREVLFKLINRILGNHPLKDEIIEKLKL